MNRAIAETKMNSLTFTNYCCQTILFCPLKQRICNYEILKNTKALLVNQKPYSLLSGSHSFICCLFAIVFLTGGTRPASFWRTHCPMLLLAPIGGLRFPLSLSFWPFLLALFGSLGNVQLDPQWGLAPVCTLNSGLQMGTKRWHWIITACSF